MIHSTHEALNNATYDDCAKEISFNRAWLQQAGFSQAMQFSSAGLIPPAITGLHNADAIKAWMDNGIRFVVGDNTRPILGNQVRPTLPKPTYTKPPSNHSLAASKTPSGRSSRPIK